MKPESEGRELPPGAVNTMIASIDSLTVGERLRVFRALFGITLEALADRVGLTRQTLTNIERGQVDPGIGSLGKMQELFGADLNVLYESMKRSRKE